MFGNLKIYHEIQNGRYFNNSILKQKTNNKKKKADTLKKHRCSVLGQSIDEVCVD